MFSFAIAFAGCLCIASATEFSETPVSFASTSVNYGIPTAVKTEFPYSVYSYAPKMYSALPESSEFFKYNTVVPQMSLSMPWMAKMVEPSKVSIMPMMAYGASYIPETYKTSTFSQELTQTHPDTMPLKTYAAEMPKTVVQETLPVAMPFKSYSPEFYTTGNVGWSTELKQTHPISTMPVMTLKSAEPYTTFAMSEPINKEFIMPLDKTFVKENVEMPVSIAKSSFTVEHKDSPTVYAAPVPFEGFKTANYLMPMQYKAAMPEKEEFVMPLATSKSMFKTPASTGLLTPTMGFETAKFPFSYSY